MLVGPCEWYGQYVIKEGPNNDDVQAFCQFKVGSLEEMSQCSLCELFLQSAGA